MSLFRMACIDPEDTMYYRKDAFNCLIKMPNGVFITQQTGVILWIVGIKPQTLHVIMSRPMISHEDLLS